MQLAEAVGRYLKHARYHQHLRPSSLEKYRRRLMWFQRFMDEYYPGVALAHITIAHLDEFVTTTSYERGHAPATTALLITILRSFFRYCVRVDLLEQDPAYNLTPPRREEHEPDVLTMGEIGRLLSLRLEPAGDPRGRRPGFDYNRRNQLIVRVFLTTGIRRAELCALRWEHLNLEDGTLKVVQGKGGKDRIVPLLPWMTQALALYKADLGAGPRDPVFTSAQGQRLKPDAITYMFVRLVTPAMGRRVTPHMLRATYATVLLNNGADLLRVSKLLGHSQLTTTRIYVRTEVEQLVAATQKHPLAESAWQLALPLEV